MTKEELLEDIKDSRAIYVLSKQKIPHYVALNESTRFKICTVLEIDGMQILIDDRLEDDKFTLLRK